MKYVGIRFLVSCIIVLATTFLVFPQSGGNSVSGIVFGLERTPLPNLNVELMNEFNSILQRTRTDATGKFLFRGVPFGRLSVRVLTLGTNYEAKTQQIEIASVTVGERMIPDNIFLDFFLKLKKSPLDNMRNEVIFAQDIPEAASIKYSKALAEFNENKMEEGVKTLQEALAVFPDYFLALKKLGLELVQLRKFEEARSYLNKAREINPKCFDCFYALSFSYFAESNFTAAQKYVQDALILEPNSATALFLSGLIFRNTKEYSKAEALLLKAKKYDKNNPDINWNLALLYAHNLKKFREAAAELEQFLKKNPNAPNKEQIKKLIEQFKEKSN
ncbi:MAG: tetratricopeptide repeat protein [Pyrinomonadaceae bacterium]